MGLTGRRLGGLALAALAYAPLHRLLRTPETGLAGTATRALTEGLWQGALWGTVITAASVAALTRFVPMDPGRLVAPAARRLAGVPASIWAASIGAIGFLVSASAARGLFAGLPTSVDAMVALAQARALAAGRLTLPLHGEPAAWMIQNAVVAQGDLVSVYPPGYVVALAAALLTGEGWIAGPIAVGALAALSFLTIERVVPHNRVATRLAGLAVALSPFVWLLGGSQLSHPIAAAATALLAWAVLKARAGGPGWALFAGAAAGALLCTRPWTGLVLVVALPAAAWLPRQDGSEPTWLGKRGLLLCLGGLPWVVLLLVWNAELFGSPFRLGYMAAFGPAHGLGLHLDPWGNRYGPLQALAYTGSDLVGLGTSLFQTPLPALAVVAAGLLVLPARRGRTVLWVWALAPVFANALYWHHGQHMGPRMLYESAPAWVALVVLALADARTAPSPRAPVLSRLAGWTVVVSLLGTLASFPSALRASRTTPPAMRASTLPAVPPGPTLLFVHGSWSARIAVRLVAAGMRRDSIETALRRNATCAVDRYARWRASGEPRVAELDFEPRAGTPPGLEVSLVSPGNRILVDRTVGLDPSCRREAASDRLGTVELEPLLWQAPPLDGQTLVIARDLGPIANARVISRFPAHRPVVALEDSAGHGLRVIGYGEGMELLWRGAASVSAVGG